MKKKLIAAILIVLMGVSGCSQAESQNNGKTVEQQTPAISSEMMDDTSTQTVTEVSPATYQKISAEDAWKLMESKVPLVVLDVRTKEEYETLHIPGAILLPNEEIGATAPPELPDKDAKILIYCRSGRRSAEAAQKLADQGYTDVSDFGGINSWPYDTESGVWEDKTDSN